jgi:intraflagellar transport protein 172
MNLAFSKDGTKLAILQSDNAIFVYKIGAEWGDKKSICNKFIMPIEITVMGWESDHLIFGTVDGKVNIRTIALRLVVKPKKTD